MGYDMHWRKKDPSEEAAVAAARDLCDKAVRVRNALPESERGNLRPGTRDFDAHESWAGRTERYAKAQDAVSAAYEDMYAAEVSYFRLNIFGMGRWREVMYELGMIYDDGPHPDWPEIEDFGITWEQVEQAESPEFYTDQPPLAPEVAAKVREYRARQDRILAWHGHADTPGIPAHKFGSNDGWIVLPAECEAALRIYTAKLEEIGRDAMDNLIGNRIGNRGRWAQWLAYLNGAISHDGFEVH